MVTYQIKSNIRYTGIDLPSGKVEFQAEKEYKYYDKEFKQKIFEAMKEKGLLTEHIDIDQIWLSEKDGKINFVSKRLSWENGIVATWSILK
jgi:hypothetical protein